MILGFLLERLLGTTFLINIESFGRVLFSYFGIFQNLNLS